MRRQIFKIGLCLLIFLTFSGFSAAVYDEIHEFDRSCDEQFVYIMPSNTKELAGEYADSYFDYNTHPYVDFLVPDGDPVFAIRDGEIIDYCMADDCKTQFPDLGCHITLEVEEDGTKYYAQYGCLKYDPSLSTLLASGGSDVEVGEIIGHAGGLQDEEGCRCDGPPRQQMRFKLLEETSSGVSPRDVFSCHVNTCAVKKPGHIIRYQGITPDAVANVVKPENICGPTDPNEIRWYGFVNMSYDGSMDLFCENDNIWLTFLGLNDKRNQTCATEVYNYQKAPSVIDKLNCFVAMVRVHNDGLIECGKIIDYNQDIEWEESHCQDPEYRPLNMQVVNPKYASSPSFNERPLMQISLRDKNTGECLAYDSNTDCEDVVVIGGEYMTIGVDDRDPVTKNEGFTAGEADPCGKGVAAACDAMNANSFNLDFEGYYVDYYLGRKCDLEAQTKASRRCKTGRMEGANYSKSYDWNIDQSGFENCQWNIIDAGKFFDTPGTYLKNFPYSRFSAGRGLEMYSNLGYGIVGNTHIFPVITINKLMWWNRWAGHRVVGAENCPYGSDACTLGAALADYYRFKGVGSPPYYPEEYAGYWRLPKIPQDIFGDELGEARRADYFNPGAESSGPGVHDYESGIPDFIIVNNSIISIETEIKYDTIRDVRWRYNTDWLQLDAYDPKCVYDGKSQEECVKDVRKWQDFLMPCLNDSDMEYECWFNYCARVVPCTWDSCRELIPGGDPNNDVDWIPCADNNICNTECQNNAQYQCSGGPGTPDGNCECLNEDPTSGGCYVDECYAGCSDCVCRETCSGVSGGGFCPAGCCVGGAIVTDSVSWEDVGAPELYRYGDMDAPIDRMKIKGSYPYGVKFEDINDNDWGWDDYWEDCINCAPNPPDYPDWELLGDPGASQDRDLSRDRYWTWEYSQTFDKSTGQKWYIDEPVKVGTRPAYESEHSGQFDGGPIDRDGFGRPSSQTRNPCEDELFYYMIPWERDPEPGGDMGAPMCWNYDIRQYRIFNVNTVWARIFKVTPEMNDYPEPTVPACRVSTKGINGKLGVSGFDCDDASDCEDEEGTSFKCSGFQGTLFNWDFDPDHCCPSDTEWDTAEKCCMPDGVWKAELFDQEYCEERKNAGRPCGLEEGHCKESGTADECAGGLICKDDATKWGGSSACCMPDQEWNGINCIPFKFAPEDYWGLSFTRSNYNPPNEGGGGPIWFHVGGGANMPNMTEAAGWGEKYGGDNRWAGPGKSIITHDDPLLEAKLIFNGPCHGNMDDKAYSSCAMLNSVSPERCYYCTAGWDFVGGQAPIWHEVGRFSKSGRDEPHPEEDYWYMTCENPQGSCDNRVGCIPPDLGPATPLVATASGTGGWTTIEPIFGEGVDGGCGNQCNVGMNCINNDCTCMRDLDGPGDACPDLNYPYDTNQWSCKRKTEGYNVVTQQVCPTGPCDPSWTHDNKVGTGYPPAPLCQNDPECCTDVPDDGIQGNKECWVRAVWVPGAVCGESSGQYIHQCCSSCRNDKKYFKIESPLGPQRDILPRTCSRMDKKQVYLPRYQTQAENNPWIPPGGIPTVSLPGAGHGGINSNPDQLMGYPALTRSAGSPSVYVGVDNEGQHPQTWIEYAIFEDGQMTCPGGNCDEQPRSPKGWAEYPPPGTERETNILPKPTDPWTLLRYESLPPAGHRVDDTTVDLRIEAEFHANTTVTRVATAHQCMWLGCSMVEHVLSQVEVHNVCGKVTGPGEICAPYCVTPSTPGGSGAGLPEVCGCGAVAYSRPICDPTLPCDIAMIGWEEEHPVDWSYTCSIASRPELEESECVVDCCGNTEPYRIEADILDVCKCKNICWGCWTHWHVGAEDNNWHKYYHGYPATDPDTGEIFLEYFNEHSYVSADPYGEHLEVSKSISNQESETYMNVSAFVQYDREKVEYDSLGWIKLIARLYQNGVITDEDVFNGLELTVPDSESMVYNSFSYPQYHDLTVLWSAPRKYNHSISDWDVVRTLKQFPCKEVDDDYHYYFSQINPLKKYYYHHTQYSGLFQKYNWDVTLICPAENSFLWWKWDTEVNVGLLRNFHEDEYYYWDNSGVYPMEVIKTIPAEINDPDSYANTGKFEYGPQNLEQFDNAYVVYAPSCNPAEFSPPAIPVDSPGHPHEPKWDRCRPGVGTPNGDKCEFVAGAVPIGEYQCKQFDSTNKGRSPEMSCSSKSSPYQNFCDSATGEFNAYLWDVIQFDFYWDGSACQVEIIKDCKESILQEKSYNIVFNSKGFNATKIEDMQLKLFSHMRSIEITPFA